MTMDVILHVLIIILHLSSKLELDLRFTLYLKDDPIHV